MCAGLQMGAGEIGDGLKRSAVMARFTSPERTACLRQDVGQDVRQDDVIGRNGQSCNNRMQLGLARNSAGAETGHVTTQYDTVDRSHTAFKEAVVVTAPKLGANFAT